MAEKKAAAKTEKIEREYIIPLRHRWKIVPRYQKTNKAVKAVKEFLVRHMKIRDRDLDKIKLDRYLNETLWNRGIRNPPSKIKVLAIKEGDIVRVTAVNLPTNIKFKKIREEKVTTKAKAVAEKRKEEKVEEKPAEKSIVEENAEKKAEEKEKKEAVVEAGKEIEKADAKKEKHTSKVLSPKQEKNLKNKYNVSGRGH